MGFCFRVSQMVCFVDNQYVEGRDAELRLKERELDLKQQELVIKKQEVSGLRWNNPLTVALIAGLVTLLGAVLQFQQQRNLLALEELKFQSNLILESVKTGNQDQATRNLRFFLDVGILEDSEGRLRKILMQPSQPVQLPPKPDDAQPQRTQKTRDSAQ